MKNTTRLFVSLLALGALTATANAAEKLRLERTNWGNSPYARYYMSLIDSDGRVITGKTAAEFKLSLDGAEQDAQAQVDQVDIGDGKGDLAGEHHALVEHAVEQFQQGELLLRRACRRRPRRLRTWR